MSDAVRRRIAPTDGLSHVAGRRTPALTSHNIAAFFLDTVQRHPQQEAAVFSVSGERWSYAQLARRVDRFAAGLLALGLYKGDRIGIWSPNRPEWLIAQLATARIGAILVNINPAYRTGELEYALTKVGAKALIVARQFKSSDYLKMLRELAPELDTAKAGRLRARRLPALTTVIQLGREPVSGTFSFDAVMARGGGGQRRRLDAITRSLNCHDAINIQFTSGTTGSPKGATLSHHNIVNNARFCADAMAFSTGDRLCIAVPLYHCFGMVLGNLVCIASASTMIFPGEGFDALQCLQALDRERCTAIHGVPTMFEAIVNHPRFAAFDLRSLRTGIMAGSPCPVALMRRVVSEMHAREITIAYGMTETSPLSFQSAIDDNMQRRVATVGRIQPHVEVRIVDDNGDTAPVGQAGELLTRGYCVMQGYWGDPEQTREAIDNQGWMHTGDIATLDADGYCNIVGRVKDMLIRGGENIYPREIEEFLYRHPAVQSAQVFGVPDERLGEEVCAWITLKPGTTADESAIRAFCQGQIAHYKVPRYIRFVTDMPMTVTGKPQKFLMRDSMIEELGLKVGKTA